MGAYGWISGAEMSGIAKVLAGRALKRLGSAEDSVTRRLENQNIIVYQEHSPANLKPGVELVASSAIPHDNELLAAHENIPFKRSDAGPYGEWYADHRRGRHTRQEHHLNGVSG